MLAILIAITVIWMRPTPEAKVIALSTWRSPTQTLLRPPVAAASTTGLQLGQGFFKIQILGEIHAK
jgi:hypothetical protein